MSGLSNLYFLQHIIRFHSIIGNEFIEIKDLFSFFTFRTIYKITTMINSMVYFQFHLYNIAYHRIKTRLICLVFEDTFHD